MKKDEIRRRARNPKFISGIHNYCDRWCERCEMTARCAIYEPVRDRRRPPGGHDQEPREFWDELGETLAETLEMVREMAAQRGISLDGADMEAYERKEKRRHEAADAHSLARLSRAYADAVEAWFKPRDALFREKERELESARAMELPGRRPAKEAEAIEDAIEVIRWHQYQIHVKLTRALLHEPLACDGPDDPTDADGSTKVALLGADRSLASWERLRGHFPAETDSILDLMVLLARIRSLAETTFPKARAFVRPGFDAPAKRGRSKRRARAA